MHLLFNIFTKQIPLLFVSVCAQFPKEWFVFTFELCNALNKVKIIVNDRKEKQIEEKILSEFVVIVIQYMWHSYELR